MRKTTLLTGFFLVAVVALAAGCGSAGTDGAAPKAGSPDTPAPAGSPPATAGAPQAEARPNATVPAAPVEQAPSGERKPVGQAEEQARAAWALLDEIDQLVGQGKAAEAADLGGKLDEVFDAYAQNVPDAALRERVEDAVHALGRALRRDPEKAPELVRQVREGLKESARAMGFSLP